MKAAVLHAPNDIRYEEVAVPDLSPNEVLVRVKAAGICGSDLPRVMGNAARFYPIILGHEFSGVVEQVGGEVTRVAVGDRVAGIPLLPCRRCPDCQAGHFAQCKHYSFIGSRENGSWAEYVKLPETNVMPVRDAITFEEAALFEPSAVALHALMHIGYRGGEHVAVLGGGNIGLLTLQWAKIWGARTVTVFDIDDDRLQTARKLGADFAVNTLNPHFMELCADITGGRGFGVVMETAGAVATMRLSFELAGSHAKVCFVGTPSQDLTFPFSLFEQMNRKEFLLTGSWMSYNAPFPGKEWELTAHFAESGELNLKDIVFRRFQLSQVAEAFEMYRKPGEVKGKILLLPD